ncbi:hypothetical protein ACK8HX_02220 [Oryzobacter sp. R7]|uniref:hypothetical protein n=1 Tax=Oryzobacter faecalis TaxID=3388656 RepID=UPI00398C991A
MTRRREVVEERPVETPSQWCKRVLAEHGPPPQELVDHYHGLVSRVTAREALAGERGAS